LSTKKFWRHQRIAETFSYIFIFGATVPRKIIFKTQLSPGDICTLTAAIESLHATYPGGYITDVRTSCDELFLHNPNITKLADGEGEEIEVHYTDLIGCCDAVPNTFLRGYCFDIAKQLGIWLELTTNRPHLYLSDSERGIHPLRGHPYGAPGRYWLVNAGTKRDYTLKRWPVEYYQQVIDHFRGTISFVQIGSGEHDHPPLDGVLNLVDETNTRQLLCLAFHAQGGLGPITFLQHICAAFEKRYIALLGGREPVIWTQYPLQTTLHTMGRLPCCRTRACWRSRVVALGDGSEQDSSLCEMPVLDFQRPVGKCMAMIEPLDVIRAIELTRTEPA
jgi:ADP-heptose:LPS heptosyltransferase